MNAFEKEYIGIITEMRTGSIVRRISQDITLRNGTHLSHGGKYRTADGKRQLLVQFFTYKGTPAFMGIGMNSSTGTPFIFLNTIRNVVTQYSGQMQLQRIGVDDRFTFPKMQVIQRAMTPALQANDQYFMQNGTRPQLTFSFGTPGTEQQKRDMQVLFAYYDSYLRRNGVDVIGPFFKRQSWMMDIPFKWFQVCAGMDGKGDILILGFGLGHHEKNMALRSSVTDQMFRRNAMGRRRTRIERAAEST